MTYHLAQINVARMKGASIDDPVMQEFVDNLDGVNALAEQSAGFVWRLKDDTDNATHLNPYDDQRMIVNMSVWESIAALQHFTFKTFHADFLRRRKAWFERFESAHSALWWIPAGEVPTLEEGVQRLAELQKKGPTARAFNFKKVYPPPTSLA